MNASSSGVQAITTVAVVSVVSETSSSSKVWRVLCLINSEKKVQKTAFQFEIFFRGLL